MKCLACGSELDEQDLTPIHTDKGAYYFCDACLDNFHAKEMTQQQIIDHCGVIGKVKRNG